MSHLSHLHRSRAATVTSALLFLTTLFSSSALPQAAPAKPIDTTALLKRVDMLEQRLAALERALQSKPPASKPAQGGAAQKVVAPFVVTDDKGKVLLTVDRSPKGNARLTVGNLEGVSVALGASDSWAGLQIFDTSSIVRLGMIASGEFAFMRTLGKLGETFTGHGDDNAPLFQIKNNSKIPVAELRGMQSEAGQLMIATAAGDIVVQAGVTGKGIGVVKAGPNGYGVGSMLGNQGLPASEIQGHSK